jgi:hypothetical protein
VGAFCQTKHVLLSRVVDGSIAVVPVPGTQSAPASVCVLPPLPLPSVVLASVALDPDCPPVPAAPPVEDAPPAVDAPPVADALVAALLVALVVALVEPVAPPEPTVLEPPAPVVAGRDADSLLQYMDRMAATPSARVAAVLTGTTVVASRAPVKHPLGRPAAIRQGQRSARRSGTDVLNNETRAQRVVERKRDREGHPMSRESRSVFP